MCAGEIALFKMIQADAKKIFRRLDSYQNVTVLDLGPLVCMTVIVTAVTKAQNRLPFVRTHGELSNFGERHVGKCFLDWFVSYINMESTISESTIFLCQLVHSE